MQKTPCSPQRDAYADVTGFHETVSSVMETKVKSGQTFSVQLLKQQKQIAEHEMLHSIGKTWSNSFTTIFRVLGIPR